MKKIIYSILCLSMIISSFNSLLIHAENEKIIEENNNINAIDESEYDQIDISLLDYSIDSSNQVTINECDTSVSGKVIIPETIDGYPVVKIDDEAFYSCVNLEGIILPANLIEIGNSAISRCTNLKEVVLPEGLISIKDYAFSSNSNLFKLEIPFSVTEIGKKIHNNSPFVIGCYKDSFADEYVNVNNYSYYYIDGSEEENTISGEVDDNFTWSINKETGEMIIYCDGDMPDYDSTFVPWSRNNIYAIKNVEITGNCTSIGDYMFYGCEKMENIIIPDTVTSIGSNAFGDASDLKSIDLPDSLVEIGDLAFYGCSSLKEIVIPEGVKDTGTKTFGKCRNLEKVTLPKNLEIIGTYSFEACEKLTSIDIPNSVTTINEVAFFGTGLKEVEIPYSVNLVERNAFYQAYSLEKIVFYNPNCEIYDIFVLNNANVVIYGYKGSTAEEFANTNELTFKEIETYNVDKMNLDVKLSYTKTTYNGKKKSPSVTVVDDNGNELVKGEDYTVKYGSTTRKNVGRYSVTITFKGNYKGTKKLWFTIVPKAPATVSAELYGYDDVKVSWSESTGASGYYVYYKKSSASSYTLLGTTTKLYYKKANLSDGVKYTFKVVPYYESSSGTKYKALKSKTDTIYTLKKLSAPEITKYSSTKVKVSWDNISGESGYQISRSSSSTGTYIVSTYATDSASYKNIKATSGKVYYYKVRVYVEFEDGTRIYGPWSKVTKYTLK